MASFFIILLNFGRAFWRRLDDPEFRAMLVGLSGLLAGGTVFYATVEGWRLIDSLYFCVMTLSTVGYGDLHPTTPVSKIFTMLYVVVGAGLFVAFITKITEHRWHPVKRDESEQP